MATPLHEPSIVRDDTPVWDVLRPGDKVVICKSWDYGPPPNPRIVYTVDYTCGHGRCVALLDVNVSLPWHCLRRVT